MVSITPTKLGMIFFLSTCDGVVVRAGADRWGGRLLGRLGRGAFGICAHIPEHEHHDDEDDDGRE